MNDKGMQSHFWSDLLYINRNNIIYNFFKILHLHYKHCEHTVTLSL